MTGCGLVSRLGAGAAAHTAGALVGPAALADDPELARLGLPSRVARVGQAALEPGLARIGKLQKLLNRQALLAVIASIDAMEAAGLDHAPRPRAGLGVVMGVSPAPWPLERFVACLGALAAEDGGGLAWAAGHRYVLERINPLEGSLHVLHNLPAAAIAIQHDARGGCRAIDDGMASGLMALRDAAILLDRGAMAAVLTGAAEAPLEPLAMLRRRMAWGPVPLDPPGEGAAVLALEAPAAAEARGAAALGWILGTAATAGGGSWLSEERPARLAERLAETIERALDAAGPPAPAVVLGTGLSIPTAAEAEEAAVRRTLGHAAPRQAPAALGHLGAAQGPASLALWLLGAIPPDGASGDRALALALGEFGAAAAVVAERRPHTEEAR